MSQSWQVPVVAGDTVATALTTKVNDALEALRTLHSGATAPTTTVAYMLWADTANNLLKQRNAANSDWVVIAAINARNHVFRPMVRIGPVSGTDQFYLLVARDACRILGVSWLTDTATSGSDGSNNYAVQIMNHTQANNLRATAWDTFTDAELAADAENFIAADQNQDIAVGDVIEIQITQTGSPTSLAGAECAFQLDATLRGA